MHTHTHACFCKYVRGGGGGAPNWGISQTIRTCQQIWSSWSSMDGLARKSHPTGPTNLPSYHPHKHNPTLPHRYLAILNQRNISIQKCSSNMQNVVQTVGSKEGPNLLWKPNIHILNPFSWSGRSRFCISARILASTLATCALPAKMEKVEL